MTPDRPKPGVDSWQKELSADGSDPLEGKNIFLRPLVPDDLEHLYLWENNPDVWAYGDCGYEPSRDIGTGCESVTTATERFSREDIRKFIENQQHGISVTGQLRLAICRRNSLPETAIDTGTYTTASANPDEPSTAVPLKIHADITEPGSFVVAPPAPPLGFIDLFDLDPTNRSAGVGILICNESDRRKGYASEALRLLMKYAGRSLELSRLWCNIAADNSASIALFSTCGFSRK
ncbi:MAG: GNAT family N-acetyltransferase [Alistipes sp.]|jgi:diamine N-acetyltransferase|nr:GNAT family N-acetyltransferase [Alistipes sp.]